MDPKLKLGLDSQSGFSVGLILFRGGRTLSVLLLQPEWLSVWSHEWLLPETRLQSGETIRNSADRLAVSLAGRAVSATRQMGTYTRSYTVGALTTCYATIPMNTRLAYPKDTEYWWASVEYLQGGNVFRNLVPAVHEALAALVDDIEGVARLISRPHFTIAELQRGLNELRRIAGRSGQVDLRNLRRTIAEADWLVDTTHVRTGGAHRPSRLYMVKDLVDSSDLV